MIAFDDPGLWDVYLSAYAGSELHDCVKTALEYALRLPEPRVVGLVFNDRVLTFKGGDTVDSIVRRYHEDR